MKIDVTIDIDLAVKVAQTVLKKLPYATNNAITRVAKEAVAAGKEEIARQFTVRKRFIQSRIKVLQYSRVGNLTAVIGIDRNVQGSPLLLGFFEEGNSGEKLPQHGSELAIPVTGDAARPEFSDPVVSGFKYTNLQLTGGKGKKQTFVVPGVGVFRRVAKGGRMWDKAAQRMITTDKSATAIVYSFKPSAPLRARMDLMRVFREVVDRRFAAIFAEEFVKEVTHQRGH
jgi:hypothetical protein